jgi:type II secretory pathway component PulM
MLRLFEQRSARERRLLVLTAVALFAALAFLAVTRARDRIDALDANIAAFEQQLHSHTEQMAAADEVYQAFQHIAFQHSSQWTQEEIHDRLRVEIARLSMREVPPAGSPLPASAGAALVEIRQMPIGALEDSDAGYRSYQIDFRTEPTSIQNLTTFIQRLQQSPQALRIDTLDIIRDPLSAQVTARLRVTRTIIDDADAPIPAVTVAEPDAKPINIARNAGFERWDPNAKAFPDWEAQDLAVGGQVGGATEGYACLHAQTNGPTGELYQQQDLRPGANYDLYLDARLSGKGVIRVAEAETGAPLPGEQSLRADGEHYRYHLRFTTPDSAQGTVALRAPLIVLQNEGAVLLLDNIVLMESRG